MPLFGNWASPRDLQSPLFAQTMYTEPHHGTPTGYAKMGGGRTRQQHEVPRERDEEYLAQEMGKLTNELK